MSKRSILFLKKPNIFFLDQEQEQQQEVQAAEESWDDSLDAEGEPEEQWEEESIVTLSSSKRSIYEVDEEPNSSPTGEIFIVS